MFPIQVYISGCATYLYVTKFFRKVTWGVSGFSAYGSTLLDQVIVMENRFIEAMNAAWLTEAEISRYFDVSLCTVKRWKKTGHAPTGVIQALRLFGGECPELSKKGGWEGWRFNSGKIWSPEGDSFTPSDLMAFTRYWQYTNALESKLRNMEKAKEAEGLAVKGSNIIQFPLSNERRRENSVA